jgi:hypothetical protein
LEPEEPKTRSRDGGISRRKMLKRIGAGAAVAWSAPILTSLGTPAFAASPACGPTCDVYACNSLNPICGASGPNGLCICSKATDGTCFCWADDLCSNRTPCGPGGACPAGQKCVSNCCDQTGGPLVCWDPCSSARTRRSSSAGQTGSGA